MRTTNTPHSSYNLTDVLSHSIGPLILLIFCGVLVFGWFYVYFFIPETKGLSLEEVDEMYRANVKPWRSGSWRPSQIGEITQDSSTKGVGEKTREEIVESTLR